MPLEKIYIARHGFRLNWHNNMWTSHTGLARDIPLTAYGEAQAEILAKYFQDLPEHERPTAVFSSSWYRCVQTSAPVAKTLGVPIYVDQGFGEWFSPAAPGTGLHPRPGPTSSLVSHFPLVDPRYEISWLPSRYGEDVAQVHNRTLSFLRTLFTRHDLAASGAPLRCDASLGLEKHRRILLVAHAASVITMARALTGDYNLSMRVGCCSLSTLVPNSDAHRSSLPLTSLSSWTATTVSHNSLKTIPTSKSQGNALPGNWNLIQSAVADFLPNGAEREWGFEDIEVSAGTVINDIGEKGTEDDVEDENERGLQVELPDFCCVYVVDGLSHEEGKSKL